MKTIAFKCFLSAFVLLLCACKAMPVSHDVGFGVTAIKVPFVAQQAPNLCGLASAEMLTGYYSITLNDEQRKALSDEAAKKQGVNGAVLKKMMEEAGYFVAIFPGTLDFEPTGIYRHLDNRRPLIAMVGEEDGKKNHYVLIVGYDPERKLIALSDPNRGQVTESLENFKKRWIRANNFTLLAVPLNMARK